jgi:hypothetical protein
VLIQVDLVPIMLLEIEKKKEETQIEGLDIIIPVYY